MDVTCMSIPDWGLLIVLLLASFSLLMTVATHLAVQRVNARAAKRRAGPTPPISVLKPLCGVDEGCTRTSPHSRGKTIPSSNWSWAPRMPMTPH